MAKLGGYGDSYLTIYPFNHLTISQLERSDYLCVYLRHNQPTAYSKQQSAKMIPVYFGFFVFPFLWVGGGKNKNKNLLCVLCAFVVKNLGEGGKNSD
ncbi:hypothetical protein KAW18_13355 [candidate division WOR-3 bacterium]|nr:hypothetical protein [candidate division WOR-3 bacterium]